MVISTNAAGSNARIAHRAAVPLVRHCSDTLRGWFSGLLRRFDRIVIVGPSGCGKSTLADEVRIDDRPVIHSDDFKKFERVHLPPAVLRASQPRRDGFMRVPHELIEQAERKGESWPNKRIFEQLGMSEEIIKACDDAGKRWLFEGVWGSRILRKAVQIGRPQFCDAVVLLERPRRHQWKGQQIQAKGIMTVFNEWRRMDRNRTPIFKPPDEDYEDED